MKIGVLGAGTAGVVSILSMLEVLYDSHALPHVEITCVHDSKTPITTVGESASTAIYRMLFRLLNFDIIEDVKEIDATLRYNTKYFWEKASGNTFTVNYGYPGIHLNSEKFASFVIDKLVRSGYNLKVVDDKIESIGFKSITCEGGEYEFDYIIDSLGTPKNFNGYEVPEFVGVNSAVIYPHFQIYNEEYTSSYVHDNGWMFGVPLQHRKAFGYCYNNDYLSVDEAIDKFSELKDIEREKLRYFSWKHYYKKEAYQDNTLYLGNKLYFFEPHQAIPLHYYMMLTQEFMKAVVGGWHDLDGLLNSYHNMSMKEIQDLIALNYAGRNSMDTPFWKDKKDQAVNRLKTSETFQSWGKTKLRGGYLDFWAQDARIMDQYINGYGIDLKELITDTAD